MESDVRPEKVDAVSFYRLIRSRLDHEDLLIVNRLSWLVASQSFLFTAYAVVSSGLTAPAMEPVRSHYSHLIRLLPLVGMFSSALIYTGILAALRALTWLRSVYLARGCDEASLGLPPLFSPPGIMAAGLAAPIALPPVFVVIWLYLVLTFPG